MAKVKLNPVLEQLRGQIGDLVFKRYGDGVVVSRKPDMSEANLSEAQLAHRERFRQGILYGRMAMADPEARALYVDRAQARGEPVFSLLVADFFNAPTVEEVDLSAYGGQSGDEIVVMADDDFDVADVQVAIANDRGGDIEAGAAEETPAESGRWVYVTSADVPTGTTVRIAVTATDRPGNVAEVKRVV